jgi:hypothetical protein
MLVVVLLLSLSSAMDDGEFDNVGCGGGGGGGLAAAMVVDDRDGIQWRWWWGCSMAVAVWQCSTSAIDYGKVMLRGRWCLMLVVAGGDGV